MTYDQLCRQTIEKLTPVYGRREASALTETALRFLKSWSRTDYVVNSDLEPTDYIVRTMEEIAARLLEHEPIQYITGEAYWHGLTLKVTPDVLIPRPETSELVDMIADSEKGRDLQVADLCTGSGCIAIALALALDFATVAGVDISGKALEVARENSRLCHARVNWTEGDVLSASATFSLPAGGLDIIVSNPPYVLESEKSGMEPNVLDHEPWLALFVPDSDPLKFYSAIARHGLQLLKPGGRLYFEINPLEADALVKMLRETGYTDCTLSDDIHGRKRFARCVKPA